LKARVQVTLKRGVLDTQGVAIRNALKSLGFDTVDEVRAGKLIELDLQEGDPAAARRSVEAMCKKLLVNDVIETYSIDLAG
jgi:phosphoribosylformylglycinamidine synthase